MPRSKRDRQITLSKTQKKVDLDHKNEQVKKIQDALIDYDRYITFSTDNARNKVIKQLRLDWKDDSRFFYTKNSLIKLAFGRDTETEKMKNLAKLGDRIVRNVGLLMTNKTVGQLQKQLDTYNEYDFARGGVKSIATVTVKAGSLKDFVTHSEEPYLRTKLGLPVKLDRGIVQMLQDHTICRFGDILSVDQCLQLKTFKVKLAEFRITLDAVYEKDTNKMTIFEKPSEKEHLLEHLTYNSITIDDGDYKYEWIDEPNNDMES